MAWSYDESNLSTTTVNGRLNVVRLLLGDTDENDQQVQDEEALFSLAQTNNNTYYAAAWCARTVASKYSRLVTTKLDGALESRYSDLAAQYIKLADALENQGKKAGAVVGVAAGGISKTDVNNVRSNTDRIGSAFRRDRFKNPSGLNGEEYYSDYE